MAIALRFMIGHAPAAAHRDLSAGGPRPGPLTGSPNQVRGPGPYSDRMSARPSPSVTGDGD
eukprot:2357888-Rhodomonas_salina.1